MMFSDRHGTALNVQHPRQFGLWWGNRPHPTLEANFSRSEVESLFEEDLLAGRTVPLLLTSVIFGGLILGIVSVLLCG